MGEKHDGMKIVNLISGSADHGYDEDFLWMPEDFDLLAKIREFKSLQNPQNPAFTMSLFRWLIENTECLDASNDVSICYEEDIHP